MIIDILKTLKHQIMIFKLHHFEFPKEVISTELCNSLKFKHAIAKSLDCKSYLEYGVSNDMAPIAFLDATPKETNSFLLIMGQNQILNLILI